MKLPLPEDNHNRLIVATYRLAPLEELMNIYQKAPRVFENSVNATELQRLIDEYRAIVMGTESPVT